MQVEDTTEHLQLKKDLADLLAKYYPAPLQDQPKE